MKICFFALALLCASGWTPLVAQGGPPMITDDPGTPGPNHWEINLGWTAQQQPGTTLYGVPLLDANYGVGDRIQINYQASYGIINTAGAVSAGYSTSQLAIKWRYYDGGDQGWQASIYPRVFFLDPGSHDYQVGLADSATTFLMPLEVVKDLGPVSLNVDFGRMFSTDPNEDGWTGGVALGRDMVKGWELDAEVHATTASSGLAQAEWIANVGTRIDLTENFTLMAAVGRDITDNLLPRTSLLSYLGFQLRLGSEGNAAAPGAPGKPPMP